MKPYATLGLLIFAILALLALGAFFSPTYTQQMGYAEGFMFVGALWFIASVVILVATFGFRTFAFYLAVLLAMTIGAFGIYGGFMMLGLTYLSWGFVFALQLLLVHHRVETAIAWFRQRYTYRAFYAEYRLFYPMTWILFLFLDVIPALFYHDRIVRFDPSHTLQFMRTILPKG